MTLIGFIELCFQSRDITGLVSRRREGRLLQRFNLATQCVDS